MEKKKSTIKIAELVHPFCIAFIILKFFLPFIIYVIEFPILIFMYVKSKNEFDKEHVKTALNFRITMFIITVLIIIIMVGLMIIFASQDWNSLDMIISLGLVYLIVAGLGLTIQVIIELIFSIIATTNALSGKYYIYPIAFKFIK